MTEPATEPDAPDVESATAPSAEVVQFRGRESVTAKLTYARALSDSGLLPAAYRGKPANVLFAVEFGEMLGLAPMAAITGVHIIEGRPSASAALISALVRRAGHRLRVSGDDKSATAVVVRSDDPGFEFKSTWTIERAKQAGLVNKDVWKKYPAAMLKARAVTEAARDACEEALSGMHYTPEELGASVDEDGNPTGSTTVEQVEVDWNAEIRKCGNDRERLLKLWKTAPNDEIRGRIKAAAEKSGVAKPKQEKTQTPAEDEPETVDAEIVEDVPDTARGRLDRAIRDNGWDPDKVEDLFIGQHGAELSETTNDRLLDSFREQLFSLSDSDLKVTVGVKP
jgi:hypothetical protein